MSEGIIRNDIVLAVVLKYLKVMSYTKIHIEVNIKDILVYILLKFYDGVKIQQC